MRSAALTFAVIGLVAMPSFAHAQGSRNGQRVPPGQLPPPGQCRVWYDDVPPGRQPAPTSCRDAERVASRDRRARVIYGSDAGRQDGRSRPRAVPRGDGSGYPRAYGYGTVAFDNGYRDGYDKGREDGRDNDDFDPVRHGRYRDGDRGYDRRYGTREEYRLIYRDGFEAGYEEGYLETNRARGDRRRSGTRLPWPLPRQR